MPSPLHTELIRRALCWLSNIATQKGIRGCPEIILSEGYVADGGAIMNLQWKWQCKFMTDEQRLKREIDCDDYTFVIESKASRSDFQKTFVHGKHLGDRLTPKANFHFIVTAKNVVNFPSEIPSFWGHLEESRNGLRLIRAPQYCPQPISSIHEFAYRILRYADVRKYMIMGLKEEPQPEEQHTELSIPDSPS